MHRIFNFNITESKNIRPWTLTYDFNPQTLLKTVSRQITMPTRGKVLSWEYRSQWKRNSRPPASVTLCWVSWVENVLLIYYASSDLLVCLHWKLVCLHWKKSPVSAFLDSNLHTRLAIVTENELGRAFPPRNLPKKIRPDPSTFYLVIVVTNKQTDRQTNAGKNIILRESFRGDNNWIQGQF